MKSNTPKDLLSHRELRNQANKQKNHWQDQTDQQRQHKGLIRHGVIKHRGTDEGETGTEQSYKLKVPKNKKV